MKRTITVDPVTRIEGHATVIIHQGSNGDVTSARMVVNELRGFERILVGMKAEQMPLITSRICGVCPSAHHLTSAKALEAAAGIDPPPAAKLLRELLYMGHFIHSHALSLFVLQGPDILLDPGSSPQRRNIVGLLEDSPDLLRQALRLRSLGQKINETIGGRGTHSVTAVVGGISFDMTEQRRQTVRSWIDEALELAMRLGGMLKETLLERLDRQPDLLSKLSIPSYYLSTVNNGALDLYQGRLRVIDQQGNEVADFEPEAYAEHLSEKAYQWSYMKPVLFVDRDHNRHLYRVNTLARLNCIDRIDTPAAQQLLEAFRQDYGCPCHATALFTYARIIELIYACERAEQLISDSAITGTTRTPAPKLSGRGVGSVEAPRGTLIHDYQIDDDGNIATANLIVATQQNYAAINHTLLQTARLHLNPPSGAAASDEELVNAIEFSIRCYDPCLSCATHAIGSMPLDIRIITEGEHTRHVSRERETDTHGTDQSR